MRRLSGFLTLLFALLLAPLESLGQPITANRLQLNGAAVGSSPSIQAVGQDTNIGITFITKGTGVITMTGQYNATATINSTTLTTNVQPLAGDLTLSGTGIGHTGGYDAGMMGNVLSTGTVTAAGNNASTTAGVIGKYTVTGTGYTPGYPRAGVVGEAAGTLTDAGVMSVVTDGDNPPSITVNSFYMVDNQASTSTTIRYGMDLRGVAHDVYSIPVYSLGDIQLLNTGRIASVTVAITAGVTTCAYPAGTWVHTSNATGRLTLWICDGTNYQKSA